MKFVIAKKPSVAQSLAKLIGATNKFDGYLEGHGYIVSWCVGHLIELAEPGAYYYFCLIKKVIIFRVIIQSSLETDII